VDTLRAMKQMVASVPALLIAKASRPAPPSHRASIADSLTHRANGTVKATSRFCRGELLRHLRQRAYQTFAVVLVERVPQRFTGVASHCSNHG
jgi:hypothetical protein